MKPLNPFKIDLEKATLIEASAGTGKTYTITTLFCRLIAIGYSVESILVVTFTEAAAAELKLRIRARLFDTLTSLSVTQFKKPDDNHDGSPGGNHNVQHNVDQGDDLIQFLRHDQDITMICQRFAHALNCFDQTSIMTIHSFCLKILKEHAFESSTLFDIELLPDRTGFLNQVSYDFFMTHVNNQDILFLSYLNSRQITPQNFISSFDKAVSRKDIVIQPLSVDFINIFDKYRQTVKKIHDTLLTKSEEVVDLILNHKGIDKRSYTKRYVPGWLEKSCKKIETEGENALFKMAEKGDALYKFTQTRIAQKTKSGNEPPKHELFELCEKLIEFYDIFENNLISLKIKFISFFNSELEKMKKRQGICFFDDLVNDLADALENIPGNLNGHVTGNATENRKNPENQNYNKALGLQDSVRQNYKACLIDEFQDTDPKQYEIFSRLFSRLFLDGRNDKTPFFMIGDPKQAIYAFRGGDIFAYLKASQECDQSFTLEKNYRSAPLLVKGVNEIFLNSISPFLFEQIKFSKVSTPSGAPDFLQENQKNIAPLQFCFIKRDNNGISLDRQGFISKAQAFKIIPEVVAQDIVSLLASDKTLMKSQTSNPANVDQVNIDQEKISPENIAILVRTNDQAQQIKAALSDYNVPSFLSKSGSVFDSKQAMELHDILLAVHDANDSSYIRTALCTSVFGFTAQNIIELNENQDLLYKWQERFINFKQIWDSKGFTSMIMALFHHEDAFLHTNPGLDERGLTNFYHLVELISQVSLNRQLSPYYLLEWYTSQLSGNLRDLSSFDVSKASSGEYIDELRLETDKKAVAIVTIHKSKGLEYPIVYLPYLWEGQRKTPTENILFHDPDQDYKLTLDLGSHNIETAMQYYETEEKAEQRRLLYVALTRASAMCRIIWGGFNTIEASALGSILHAPASCKDDHSMIDELGQLETLASKSILIEDYSDKAVDSFMQKASLNNSKLSARQTKREVKSAWKMSSFSSISHSATYLDTNQNRPNKNRQNSDKQNNIKESQFQKNQVKGNQTIEAMSNITPENITPENITLDKFPKGAGAGDFFHSIFETLDFTSDKKIITSEVQTKFDQFGFADPEMINPAITSVKEVIETKLETINRQFCLKDIKPGQRFNEMEFIFPVDAFKMSSVIKAFEKSDLKFQTSGYIKRLSQLTAQSFKGFIKGFIDLVITHKGKWYIVDYKSNYLGNTYEQYSQTAMFDAMSEHHYFLQYYIYTIALHRYLELRLKNYDYDTHFGGVFYLFIRGMHPAYGSRYGVFQDRPDKSEITELSSFKDH
jgi:exodeoxyribonuclease V beta subunit